MLLADVMSVLAMTMANEGSLESLEFRLQGSKGGIDEWGHEYVRYVLFYDEICFLFILFILFLS